MDTGVYVDRVADPARCPKDSHSLKDAVILVRLAQLEERRAYNPEDGGSTPSAHNFKAYRPEGVRKGSVGCTPRTRSVWESGYAIFFNLKHEGF